ncbi:M24 family metallopeptidase [Natronosalvus halobius]|uniref:M24 family metallopeptidase n=1 Tax=Natronosalvus halobius TaxID=2953746 RepID=UPI0020A21DFA|nr:Xaa-Pro peptidase family protein [Natronosalvus halobius]USZ73674.1 Xaa-Pro peptidase family protein [Natronosalvus halobius]
MSKATVRYDWGSRIDRAKELMKENEIDALYVGAGANQFYFTGFSAYEGGWPIWLSAYVLPLEGEPAFILSEMHRDIMKHAETSIPVDAVTTYRDGEDSPQLLKSILEERDLEHATIGLEDDAWFGDSQLLNDVVPDAELVSAQEILDYLRMRKDETEIENIRKANEIAAEAHAASVEAIEEGRPQYEVAQDVNSAMLEAGSQTMGLGGVFRELTDRPFQQGDIVDVDMGPQFNHYATDCARNVFVGDPAEEDRRAYEVCSECIYATMDIVEPGITAHEVHTFAEEYMADAGYDQPWKIGHGIGLMSGHEAPQVQENNHQELEEGMVIVIDPGIFVSGHDLDVPIHIEDPVLVTEDGCENLLDYTHDIVTV